MDRLVNDGDVLTAMMLLEMAFEIPINPVSAKYGSVEDYCAAAHSFLQVARGGPHSSKFANEMVARIRADAVIEDAMDKWGEK